MSKSTTFEAIWTIDSEGVFQIEDKYLKSSAFSPPNREHLLEFKLENFDHWMFENSCKFRAIPLGIVFVYSSSESIDVKAKIKFSILLENGIRVQVSESSQRLAANTDRMILVHFNDFCFQNSIQQPKSNKFTIICQITYDESQLIGAVKERRRIMAVEQFKRELLKSIESKRFLEKVFKTENLKDISTEEISAKLESIYMTTNLSNFSIFVDEYKIDAHKNILAARCPVFAAMLEWKDCAEAQQNEIKIVDSNIEIFKEFLKFLYTGKLQLKNQKDAFELLILADKYQIDSLKCLCEHQLSELISKKTVLKIFSFAEFYNAQIPQSNCLDWFLENESNLSTTSGEWKDFSEINENALADKKKKQTDKMVYHLS